MSWRNICQPKRIGGLGFRDLGAFNKAFLMKISWGMVDNVDDLWARELKRKYNFGNDILPVVQCQANSSGKWMGVCSTWCHVKDGLRWIVSNEKRVRFWCDRWLLSGIIFQDVVVANIPDEELFVAVGEYM